MEPQKGFVFLFIFLIFQMRQGMSCWHGVFRSFSHAKSKLTKEKSESVQRRGHTGSRGAPGLRKQSDTCAHVRPPLTHASSKQVVSFKHRQTKLDSKTDPPPSSRERNRVRRRGRRVALLPSSSAPASTSPMMSDLASLISW